MSPGKFLNKVYFCSLNSKDFKLEFLTERLQYAPKWWNVSKEKFKVELNTTSSGYVAYIWSGLVSVIETIEMRWTQWMCSTGSDHRPVSCSH